MLGVQRQHGRRDAVSLEDVAGSGLGVGSMSMVSLDVLACAKERGSFDLLHDINALVGPDELQQET
jgi:hypothetical protein